MRTAILLIAAVALGFTRLCQAAPAWLRGGENYPVYKQCVATCSSRCGQGEHQYSALLHLMLWDCESDCRYDCMHRALQASLNLGLPVRQFHGKWPFHRVFGMQEIASVLFSIFNLLGHYWGVKRFRKQVPDTSPIKREWVAYGYAAIVAWCCSTIYHCRDLYMTTLMDYLTALFAVCLGLYATLLSYLQIPRVNFRRPILAAFLGFFICHAMYFTFVTVHFSYVQSICALMSAVFVAIWMAWSVLPLLVTAKDVESASKRSRPVSGLQDVRDLLSHLRSLRFQKDGLTCAQRIRHRWRGLSCILMLCASSIFFFWDFPAIFLLVDAHALWHLSTIPFAFMWWDFLSRNVADDVMRWRPS